MKPANSRGATRARVSTTDQEPKIQLRELPGYANRRGLRVVQEFVDGESGSKPSRPQLNRLMDLACTRQLDLVVVWKFDRFALSSQQLINALEEFRSLGVDFISYTESTDTSTPNGNDLPPVRGPHVMRVQRQIGLRVLRSRLTLPTHGLVFDATASVAGGMRSVDRSAATAYLARIEGPRSATFAFDSTISSP